MKNVGLALALSLLLVAGCQAPPSGAPMPIPLGAARAKARGEVILKGSVAFPGYRLLATASELGNRATVSLLDADGVVRAAGVTDASGNFTLYQSTTPFTPTTGAFYTLEVSKRAGSGTQRLVLTMQTLLRRESAGWSSITGGTIVINATTTALVKLLTEDTNLTGADLISKVTDGATIGTITGWATEQLAARVGKVTALLAGDMDPLASGTGLVQTTTTTVVDTPEELQALYFVEQITGNLTIQNLTAAQLRLPNLKRVTGTLTIQNNANLTSLEGLGNLEAAQQLTVSGNAMLTTLRGLEGLSDVEGITVSNCPLTDLQGLGNLVNSEPSLSLGDMPTLTSLAGLSARLTALQDFTLDNVGLTDMSTMPAGITYIEYLDLTNLPSLTSLNGLANVTGLGTLYVGDNPVFASMAGFGAGSTALEMTLNNCPALTSLAGAENLQLRSGGLLNINNMTGLTSVAALNLTASMGNVQLFQLPELTSLAGLEELTFASSLTLNDLAKVSSLSALSGLSAVQVSLFVQNNAMLDADCAQALYDQLTTKPASFNVTTGNTGADACPSPL